MNYRASFGLLLSSFRFTETLHVSNLVFKNVSLVPYIASILQPGSFHADGIYLEEDINLQGKIFQIIIQGPVSIKNVHMKGYTNAGTNQMSPIEVGCGPLSDILLHDIYMDSVELFYRPFLDVTTVSKSVVVRDSVLNSVKTASEGSLVYVQSTNSFKVTNITINNSSSVDPLDTNSKLLHVNTLSYEEGTYGEISGIQVDNSSLSLFYLRGLDNPANNSVLVTLNSIIYKNSEITTNKALISTKGIAVATDLSFSLSNLTFENIKFLSSGFLLDLGHQLSQRVVISELTAIEISSGSISIEGSRRTTDHSTKLLFQNCTFRNVQTPNIPFLSVSYHSDIEIKGSSFSNFTSLSFSSGIINVIESAQVAISGTNFTKNSAITASVMKVETESTVSVDSCQIFDNFAVTNGVFEVASFGILSISNSKIYQNYAVQYPVGTVFLSVDPSNITQTEIYQNRMITKAGIPVEISANCSKLCFLHQDMKDYLANVNLSSTTEEEYIFQVLQGSLNILADSHIHSQSLVMNCFGSTVNLENLKISNLEYKSAPLNILDSVFSMKSSEVTSIVTTSV